MGGVLGAGGPFRSPEEATVCLDPMALGTASLQVNEHSRPVGQEDASVWLGQHRDKGQGPGANWGRLCPFLSPEGMPRSILSPLLNFLPTTSSPIHENQTHPEGA